MNPPDLVSAIRPHKRNADRVEVDLGDETLVVAPEFVVRSNIRVGSPLSGAEVAALRRESAIVRAMDRALLLLSHRARAKAELERRLQRLEMPAQAINEALARLTRLGYLDDAAFARQLARGRMLASGQSRFRIRSELARKGVARDVADEAIEETLAAEDVDERAIIERVAAKKLRSLAKLDPITRRRRLYAFLARRGFSVDDIRRVVDDVTGDDDSLRAGDSALNDP
jgi:regulatory protein